MEAFNFGPDNKFRHDVHSVVKLMGSFWKNIKWKTIKKRKIYFYESELLQLNSNKAKRLSSLILLNR